MKKLLFVVFALTCVLVRLQAQGITVTSSPYKKGWGVSVSVWHVSVYAHKGEYWLNNESLKYIRLGGGVNVERGKGGDKVHVLLAKNRVYSDNTYIWMNTKGYVNPISVEVGYEAFCSDNFSISLFIDVLKPEPRIGIGYNF